MHQCCPAVAASGYNGGPGSVGGTTYGAQSYDGYGQSQHAYGNPPMQPQAPSSPYGRSGTGYGAAGGFGSNPYASAAAPVSARSPVRQSCLPRGIDCSRVCMS